MTTSSLYARLTTLLEAMRCATRAHRFESHKAAAPDVHAYSVMLARALRREAHGSPHRLVVPSALRRLLLASLAEDRAARPSDLSSLIEELEFYLARLAAAADLELERELSSSRATSEDELPLDWSARLVRDHHRLAAAAAVLALCSGVAFHGLRPAAASALISRTSAAAALRRDTRMSLPNTTGAPARVLPPRAEKRVPRTLRPHTNETTASPAPESLDLAPLSQSNSGAHAGLVAIEPDALHVHDKSNTPSLRAATREGQAGKAGIRPRTALERLPSPPLRAGRAPRREEF